MTPQVNAVSILTKFLGTKEKEVGQHKGCTFKARLVSTLEIQADNLINEAISLTLMDDSSVKLTLVGEPYNLYLHLAREKG